MSAIDKVKAHYDSLSRRVIKVPEWDLDIHATPLTVAERRQIYSGVEDGDEHTPIVRILMIKARDEKGDPIFSKADEPHLMHHASPAVLFRVAADIMSTNAPDAKDLGNS